MGCSQGQEITPGGGCASKLADLKRRPETALRIKCLPIILCCSSLSFLSLGLSGCGTSSGSGSGGGGNGGGGGGGGTAGLSSINHIVFLAQENRSFDHYFGALRQYWAQNGYPDQSYDGLPQFNPASGTTPLQGPAPTIPGCDPSQPAPADCVFDHQQSADRRFI